MLSSPSPSMPTTTATTSTTAAVASLALLLMLLCHPGRKLVAIVVIDRCVVRLPSPSPSPSSLLGVVVMARLRRGEWRSRTRGGEGPLFRGIDVGVVLNLKSGHCM